MSYNKAVLATTLLNPATLSFCLGAVSRFVRSELSIPKDIHSGISIFLLLSIGLKGGHELAGASWSAVVGPTLAALLIGLITPVIAFWVGRRLARFSVTDSAAIAAHYGSVSIVTFIAAQSFVTEMLLHRPDLPRLEGFLPSLAALLESPGLMVALTLGTLWGNGSKDRSARTLIHEVITGRVTVLLVGGLMVGGIMGEENWRSIAPFFDPGGGVFRGLLCIFLLEMGISTASRLFEIKSAASLLIGIGVALPILNACVGVGLGYLAGLSVGGTAVLATLASSASYIAAPSAVRTALPDANPALCLTMALAITFPFNIVVGIPLYFYMSDLVFKSVM